MKKFFSILRRVAASVWMPPVALIGVALAMFVEDVLWFKYPALLVRHVLDFEWCWSYALVLFVLASAISVVLFLCDLLRRKWWRGLARAGLFAVGFALMCWIGNGLSDYARRNLVPTIEIRIAGKDIAMINEKCFAPASLSKILRQIYMKSGDASVAFVIGEDIGFQDFWSNFLNQCSTAGVWRLAFRTADGEWSFLYTDGAHMGCMRHMDYMHEPKIAAVRIGEGGSLSFEDNYRMMDIEKSEDGGWLQGHHNIFNDSESAVFGDGVSARYDAAAVVIDSDCAEDCRVSLVADCVRRLNEAGFSGVFLLYIGD